VVKVQTELEPMELLRTTQHIERLLGRKHKTAAPTGPAGNSNKQVYHDRTMDIDILLYDDLSIDEPTLKIPHPLMTERDFVMVPLREVMESKA
jgi:2-amino-4-hydroxy-6-hydroxymethyldihydropteridine diphosphokinase